LWYIAISITEIDKIPKPEVKRWGQIDRKREVLKMCMNTGKDIKTPINGAQVHFNSFYFV